MLFGAVGPLSQRQFEPLGVSSNHDDAQTSGVTITSHFDTLRPTYAFLFMTWRLCNITLDIVKKRQDTVAAPVVRNGFIWSRG